MLYLEDLKNLAKGGQPVTLEFFRVTDEVVLTVHTLGRALGEGVVETSDEFNMVITKALKRLADEEK